MENAMKKRSKAGEEPIKSRRRKTPEPERVNAPKASAAFNASSAVEETKVARLMHELREARTVRRRLREKMTKSTPKGLLCANPRYSKAVWSLMRGVREFRI
jgi:hypothetical protein